ncbi:MAG: lipocalin family protein [Bacteroidales bacterium]
MKHKKLFFYPLFAIILFALLSCSTIPEGVTAVSPFDKEKYLGKWYEIARFDYKYEEGLNNTTANYSVRDDGKIKVINRGYDYEEGIWKEAVGKARFVRSDTIAMLKVSFFGPFYAGYNVIAIDPDYKYALVAGDSREYLWILSREKTIPEDIRNSYVNKAEDLGFDTSELIWVEHNK